MSILVNKETRVAVCGITGKAGAFHSNQCLEFGTKIVAGVTPGKGGQITASNIPIFNSVEESVTNEGVDTALIFVPPMFAAASIMECIEANLKLIVCITEGIPVLDMVRVSVALEHSNSRLVGPNCPGIISPGLRCKIGIMPAYIHRPGPIGIVSRSGTLTYEAVWQVTQRGSGQSTCVGIGGDQIIGMTHLDVIKMFNADPETEAILMVGEIGGNSEELAAAYIKQHVKKPVAAFIAGVSAPQGRRMGHAGAIVSGKYGSAESKLTALRDAGVAIAEVPSKMAEALCSVYGR
ncbi:MAG: succinate--CoA ligase subunit alpha [Puniceicoccales bacterium]|jgi:succinyl-CoA synthetase alpha subunit|nr:succinate--CoA ligase subunit alpha [Puniceicoccales bacterium]